MFPEQPAVPKVRHSSHISLGTDSNSVQTELRKKAEHATLDFRGDTSIPVWVLRERPGICEEAEVSISSLVGRKWMKFPWLKPPGSDPAGALPAVSRYHAACRAVLG